MAGTRLRVCAAAMACMALIGCKPRRTSIGGSGVRTVDARIVLKHYSDNPIRADGQYNDAEWRIREIRVDLITPKHAVMEEHGLQLKLRFRDEGQFRFFNKGQTIVAKCEGDGMRDTSVHFEDCALDF